MAGVPPTTCTAATAMGANECVRGSKLPSRDILKLSLLRARRIVDNFIQCRLCYAEK